MFKVCVPDPGGSAQCIRSETGLTTFQNINPNTHTMNTPITPAPEENVVIQALDKVYKHFSERGYFITPREEAWIIENLLIQARIKANADVLELQEMKKSLQYALAELNKRGRQLGIKDEGYAVKHAKSTLKTSATPLIQ